MASKATEKPTGPCAACQKKGAAKRCRGCLDIGVDVFFCHRDCQVKHWKTHKAACGKSAIVVDLYTDRVLELKKRSNKLREVNEKAFCCQKCFKGFDDIGCKLRVCSKCKVGQYCSRECQVAHWPVHKERCKEIAAYEEKMAKQLTPEEAGIRNLFEYQWKFKVRMLLNRIVVTTLKKEDREQQPPTKVVHIEVEFNYNANTFLFTEAPKILPISCFDEERILEIYYGAERQHLEFQNGQSDKCPVQFAFVTCKDLGEKSSFYHAMMSPADMKQDRWATEERWSNLVEHCMDIGTSLKSDLFQGWKAIRDRNFQKQIEHLKQSPLLSMFLRNALQLFSNKPKHLTHEIHFLVNMGKEPGEITKILDYRVESFAFTRDHLSSFASKQDRQKLKEGFDMHLESRKRDPIKIIVPISFLYARTTSILALDFVSLPLDSSKKVAVKRCKRKADACFKQLQELVKKMPSHLVEKVSLQNTSP